MSTADKDRKTASTSDFLNRPECRRDKSADSPGWLAQGDTAKEVVWDSFAFIFQNFVRDNGQTIIKLHGITIDDLAIESSGNVYCKLFCFQHGKGHHLVLNY